MGRKSRKRPWGESHRELRIGGFQHSEVGPGGANYQVSQARPARKTYVCPGCFRTIQVGQPSVVAWLSDDDSTFGMDAGVDSRRHWHPHCWQRRLRPTGR